MPEAILRVTLTRGPGERGYTPGRWPADGGDDVARRATVGPAGASGA